MKSVRVLIVDDQQMIREALSLILRSHADIQVVGEAATGWEGLSQAEETRPDVVLMDISMPELNGIDATAVLKRRLPEAKVLALTVHGDERDGAPSPDERLTERERQILQLAAEGYRNREIAQRLNISYRTVETHRASIMQKLNLSDRVELVRYAIRAGIVEP